MKKTTIRFPENSTVENLTDGLQPGYDAIITFDEKVMVAQLNWRGEYEAAIYGHADGKAGDIESRIDLIEVAAETFKDSGHAIAWCMGRITK